VKPLYNMSLNKWYFDELYDATFIGGTIFISKIMSWIDVKIIDGTVNLVGWLTKGLGFLVAIFDNIIVDGLVNLVAWLSEMLGAGLRKLQTGRVQSYILISLIFIVIFVWFLF